MGAKGDALFRGTAGRSVSTRVLEVPSATGARWAKAAGADKASTATKTCEGQGSFISSFPLCVEAVGSLSIVLAVRFVR
jgi:hypothetical protein